VLKTKKLKKKMNFNLLLANNLFNCGPLILLGIIFCCYLIGFWFIIKCYSYYLIISNNTAIPSKKALTNKEIGTIVTVNTLPISNVNIDNLITDSDSETYVGSDPQLSDSQTMFNSDSSSDNESVSSDTDSFIMPDVDLEVCPIEELKLFEFNSLYSTQIQEHSVTQEDIIEFIECFSKEELATNWINDAFLFVISLL